MNHINTTNGEIILKSINDYFKLPIEPKGDKIEERLAEFLKKFKEVINNLYCNLDADRENINKVITLCDAIEAVLKDYRRNPLDAYINFSTHLSNMNIKKYLNIYTIIQKQNYYRIRNTERLANYRFFSQNDLFHHPFDIWGNVSAQRFSLPGLPCLYIGDSIYVSWEEMGRPNLQDFYVVRLEVTEEQQSFKVYDLRFDRYFLKYKPLVDKFINSSSEEEQWNAIIMFPLIAACTMIVPEKDRDKKFKPEYIIPQYLYQILMTSYTNGSDPVLNSINASSTVLIGVIYNSTKVDYERCEGFFSNIALVATRSGDLTYSDVLVNGFNMSSPTTDFLLQDGLEPSHKRTDDKENLVVTTVKMGNHIFPYKNTKLGVMEEKLRKMECHKLTINIKDSIAPVDKWSNSQPIKAKKLPKKTTKL